MKPRLGKTIRIIRQAKGLKLNDLAIASKVSTPFLSLVESGQREPSLDVLRRVAKALAVPSEALVLMGLDNRNTLESGDASTNELARAIDNLIEVEAKLGRLLDTEDPGATSRPSARTHRRGDGAKSE